MNLNLVKLTFTLLQLSLFNPFILKKFIFYALFNIDFDSNVRSNVLSCCAHINNHWFSYVVLLTTHGAVNPNKYDVYRQKCLFNDAMPKWYYFHCTTDTLVLNCSVQRGLTIRDALL